MELPPNNRIVDAQRDALYKYNKSANDEICSQKPWTKDPHYFKSVRVSSVALLKMVMHARSGGSLEVMGLMQGYVDGTAIVITDAFRLPVEGTETRVNAQDDANEYMVSYLQSCRDNGRLENAVGWYHSHPGYGCWLSGIDVSTQALQQTYNEPFVAVVVDPDRTISANKVEIGAFRTYPEGYKSAASASAGATADGHDSHQHVPLYKADDFGAHSDRYYSLDVQHFKSTLDSRLLDVLWNKYWVSTLAQNPLLTNRDFDNLQIRDLSNRVLDAHSALARGGKPMGMGVGTPGAGGTIGVGMGVAGGVGGVLSGAGNLMGSSPAMGGGQQTSATDQKVDNVVRDIKELAGKQMAGLVSTQVKENIFQG